MNLLLNLGKDPTMAPFPGFETGEKSFTGFSCKEIGKQGSSKTTPDPLKIVTQQILIRTIP
ncbi:hypothetical protein [Phascolarctobacterium faecium]|jgi:hypothetical protein|uniref:hypothetical protein n=1 Tax=Phascolarctobacterium faecium TaxID=33025 RepID=UPI001B4C90C2|nr:MULTISPECIES: hypothetical protein [Phascolarctobacterium]MBP6946660.1 hypothetical protein [Phascolarctobacterium sp.]